MFAHQDTDSPVEIAFTDRHGGISGGPFASLNLAEPGPDAALQEREAVGRNVEVVLTAFAGAPDPPPLVRMRQVHGRDVHVVDASHAETPPTGDGLVTAVPGVVLMVRVADCVPVLLADARAGVVAAAHAGRAGLVAGIVPATVAAMREAGAGALRAWVGPHVCGSCYEVPADLRDDVASVVPEAWAQTAWGTPAVDVGAGVLAQLQALGVATTRVERCTLEDEDLFSYRRQGRDSGRLAGLVWIRP